MAPLLYLRKKLILPKKKKMDRKEYIKKKTTDQYPSHEHRCKNSKQSLSKMLLYHDVGVKLVPRM